MTESGPKFADREGSRAAMPEPKGPTVYEMTVAQVRTLDRASIDEFGIPGVVLMENAARSVVPKALELLGGSHGHVAEGSVCVVCGPGNNGGDGLALARHLANAGARISVILLGEPDAFKGDAAVNLRIARRMGLPFVGPDGVGGGSFDLVIDAMFGTGLTRPLGGRAGVMAGWIATERAGGARVLSIDVPSGLDADTGEPIGDRCVSADATVTLAAVKPGLTRLEAQGFVGELTVGGIGVPAALLARLGRPWTPRGSAGREG